jgi:lysophospholipase L1-like esterase
MRATYQLLRTVKQPHLVDLGNLFDDHREGLFIDRTHVVGEGSQLIAERISQVLHDLGL